MKLPFRFVLAGAAVLAAAAPVTVAAQPRSSTGGGGTTARPGGTAAATAPLPHKVGLVDVGHIFSNYEKLKHRRDLLQKEMSASEGELKGFQEQIQGIQEQLKSGTIVKGSEQWKQLEEQHTQLTAQGQATAKNLQREFIRKEVQMYKEIYDEVAQTVATYARAPGRNYTLILRYQRATPEEATGLEDPNKIMGRVNQLVVYHQQADDITDTILGYMNSQYQQQAGRPAAPAAPARN